ncbi:TolC family protein [Chryseobacterium sp. BIGb0232]|uniref:TolC family protein n=1 Tax=Chryseobacterium sp. BIGb0232 TaxID=2940598 RepID=UPI000F9D371D|nr:TolC family protein [Chryseobacterium sp. BIGb0232]MCS4303519.1 cobalt-zinc-cadmium efflux system outer membrane protein [Chryseobacterium sp. BIGb0232]ROS11210.1 cobalt-zinc-cadmium efflux system outer membrane protein [Chryseobacterium nakagawai]
MKYNFLIILFCTVTGIFIKAQTEQEPIYFNEYLKYVKEKNLGLAAQKYNISMAEASILTAGIFPDPQIEMETSNNGVSKDMGYTVGGAVSWTLELGGKRKARIEMAKNEAEYSRLQLQDYIRNLFADATLGYIEALKAKALLNVQKESYQNMLTLAKSDSIRYRLGDISKVTSQQTRLESSSLLNEVYQLEGAQQQSVTALSDFIGSDCTGKDVSGNLNTFNRNFILNDLITQAFNERADLLASKQNINTAASRVKLEKANRVIDLGLSAGAGHNTVANNEIAPSPAVNTVKFGISVPLKFSNHRNADLKIAEMGYSQAETEYRQIENNIRMEVTQAYQQYTSVQKQLQQFDNGMLKEAENILKGITYSYQRGESSILEVLNAQRTFNELRQNYFQLLAENASALIELERKAGIWDIEF